MGERGAEDRARQAGEAPQHDGRRHIAEAGFDGKIGERAADQPEGEADAKGGEHRGAVDEQGR